MDTLTIPNWVALLDQSREKEREIIALRKQAEEAHCGYSLGGQFRCMYDTGHEGDHRIDQGQWFVPKDH